MARQKQKLHIYKRRRPLRTFLCVLGVALLTFISLSITIFFGAQRFIVYTEEGVRLDIPFLRDILDEIPESAQREPLPPEPESPGEILFEPEAGPRDPIHTAFIQASTLESLPDVGLALQNIGANAILVVVSSESGSLTWASEVSLATRFDLAGGGHMAPRLETAGEGIRRSALLYSFSNQLLAQRYPGVALTQGWLDPANEEIQSYIIDLALELVSLGFDEIVLTGFTYPPNFPGGDPALILSFLTELALILNAVGADLSILTLEEHWYNPEGPPTALQPDLGALSQVVFQFYCVLTPETLINPDRFDALMAAVESILGRGAAHRFIPGGQVETPDSPEEAEPGPPFPPGRNWLSPATLGDLA